MRVKYAERVFTLNPTVVGGTSKDWVGFCGNILNWLSAIAAGSDGFNPPTSNDPTPFNWESFEQNEYSTSTTAAGGGSCYMCFTGEPASEEEAFQAGYYAAGINLSVSPPSSNTANVMLNVTMFGRVKLNSSGGENMIGDSYALGIKQENRFSVNVRALKSGDSFYVGFCGTEDPCLGAFINYAITPMHRLSNPDETLGYGVVRSTSLLPTEFITGYYMRTLPLIDGYNPYLYGENSIAPCVPSILSYPEVETGKIPLVPLFSGVEDIYFENVYFTPMRNDCSEEKAFETDKGAFLIGTTSMSFSGDGTVINWTEMPVCQLAFDITEAVNNS